MPEDENKTRKDLTLGSIVEGKKMEAYVEHCTKDMHECSLCGMVGYKKTAMKSIGAKWVCINCLRRLKETLATLDQWEAEIQLEKEMSKTIDDGLGI
jgi:hypothetical protein